MALTYRSVKESPLTIEEIDSNFAYFTGSHDVTGSLGITGSLGLTGSLGITGSLTLIGNNTITGSFATSGSLFRINNISGSILTPTSSLNGIIPTFNGVDGQFLFGSGSDGYKLFVWIGGAWRSGSLT